MSPYLLIAEVISLVEFDENIELENWLENWHISGQVYPSES